MESVNGKATNKKTVRRTVKRKEQIVEKRVLRKKVKKATLGLTDGLTNVVLYLFYVTVNMPGAKGPAAVHRAFDQADEWIGQFDAARLRRALYNLHQQGFISTVKKATMLPKITEMGLKKLQKTFPFYAADRVWDGQLYLIVYDISSRFDRQRDLFRGILNDLKAVMVQRSVYLTPYNPNEIIRRVRREYNIGGQILTATLDPRNAFGDIGDIKEYLWDIYNLDEVNDSYKEFMSEYRHLSREEMKKSRAGAIFTYLSILRDDPQLPFELLPDRYLGDEAYLLFKQFASLN